MRVLIKHLLTSTEPRDNIIIKGWVRTRRSSKDFSFLELNDGSCLSGLQVVVDATVPGYDDIARFTTGASAVIEGKLVASQGSRQQWEMQASRIELLGEADTTTASTAVPTRRRKNAAQIRGNSFSVSTGLAITIPKAIKAILRAPRNMPSTRCPFVRLAGGACFEET